MLTVSLRAQTRLAFENPHWVGLLPGDRQFRARHDTKASTHLNVVIAIIFIVVIIVLCELVLSDSLHGGRRVATLKLPQGQGIVRWERITKFGCGCRLVSGPGSMRTNVVSGFFDIWGFISAEFLGMKCPHMYSDLGLLVRYTVDYLITYTVNPYNCHTVWIFCQPELGHGRFGWNMYTEYCILESY